MIFVDIHKGSNITHVIEFPNIYAFTQASATRSLVYLGSGHYGRCRLSNHDVESRLFDHHTEISSYNS